MQRSKSVPTRRAARELTAARCWVVLRGTSGSPLTLPYPQECTSGREPGKRVTPRIWHGATPLATVPNPWGTWLKGRQPALLILRGRPDDLAAVLTGKPQGFGAGSASRDLPR